MNISDLFWLFFIIMAFQPYFQKKMLETMRQRKIAQIEQARGSRVIALIHRQETMSFLGFPLMRYIDINDSEEVLRAIQLTDPKVPLDIILHTPGGMVIAATQIARAIRSHPGRVSVFVPHFAMSGGTLIALAADEIFMCDHSALGPIDPQLGTQPAASLQRVIEQKPIDKIDDNTLVMADMGKKAIAQIEATATALLEGTMDKDRAAKLAITLSTGKWTHDYPIFADEARALGLNINTDMPDMVLEMMKLFPQPTKSMPSVEYLPIPHPGTPGKGNK
jgi:ClpP class serine protease